MSDGDILIRRSIALNAIGEGRVQAWLADNFHHFGVTIEHDGARVTGIEAQAVRFPWTSCPGASVPLRALIGTALSPRPYDLALHHPMALNCTHLFELAALAIAHAVRGGGRRYDAVVRQNDGDGLDGSLHCEGSEILQLSIGADRIAGPAEWAGRHLYDGFRHWTDTLADEVAEQLWIMRRAFWLARGLARFRPTAVAAQTGLGPVCHTYQPEQRDTAHAMPQSRIDVRNARDLLRATLADSD